MEEILTSIDIKLTVVMYVTCALLVLEILGHIRDLVAMILFARNASKAETLAREEKNQNEIDKQILIEILKSERK